MRRLFTAVLTAMLIAGLLPLQVLAAAPTATAVPVTTDEDTPATVTLVSVDDDGDATTSFEIVTSPALGTLGVVGPISCDGLIPNTCSAEVTFTPTLNANGPDSFTFTATAGGEASAAATAGLTITPVNDPPVANDDPCAACGGVSGSFPIPEDWNGGSSGFEGWFALMAERAPMANDHDPDGDPMTFELVGQPAHGAATSLPDGFLAYDPDPDYSTLPGDEPGGTWISDVIHYRLFDGTDYSDTASYRIWLAPVNDAPSFTAGPDVTVNEDSGAYDAAWATSVSAGPFEAYQDVDFVVDSVTDPTLFATAPTISPTGELRFVPAPDQYGLSSVTVHAHDDGGLESYIGVVVTPADTSASRTFTIVVMPVNDPPVCTGTYSSSGSEDAAQGGMLACTDVDGTTLAYAATSDVSHGTRSVAANGEWTYTPAPNYTGPDSFTFTASDGTATSDPATFSITVTAANDAPVANGQSPAVMEDAAMGITLTGSDVEGSTLTYTLTGAGPAHGTLTGTAPNLTYTPALNYNGPDSFTFEVNDGAAYSLVDGTVSIMVAAVNDRPVCAGTSLATDKNVAVNGTVACNDVEGTALTMAVSTAPTRGILDVFNPATGAFTYHPNQDVTGADGFQVTASDGDLTSIPVAVDIAIANRAPVCAGVSPIAGDEDTNQAGALACTDDDGDLLTFAKTGGPQHGSVVVDAGTGAWTYAPLPNWNGTDSFTATATDGAATTPAVTVTLTVTAVNDAPDARTDGFTVNATGAGTLAVLANDFSGPTIRSVTSEPADTVTVTSVTHGAKVSVTIAAGGAGVLYDVKGCSYGGDSFTYTITDGHGLTDTATAFVTIARPGQYGLSSNPITDTPALGFITNSTIGSTVPARLSWCGVTRSGSSVRSYTVGQSTNGGSSYASTPIVQKTTARSSTRNLTVGTTYRWRARTTDSTGRTGAYKYSLTARIARYQESSTVLTYAGAWSRSATSNASGGAQKFTVTKDASATITLTNVRQFAIVGPRSSKRGSFEVWVDGARVATVSERASTTVYRRVLYVRSLTSGIGVSHLIEVRAVGNGRIDLDAILALS